MCCRSEQDFITTQKALSVAVRRTSRLPTGEPLSPLEVAQLSYYEMATGRARHVTDWKSEIKDRCTKPLYLKLPFDPNPPSEVTNNMYLAELEDVLIDVMKPLAPKVDTETTFFRHCLTRQEWCSSRNSGGFKVLIENKWTRVQKHSLMEEKTVSEMSSWVYEQTPALIAKGSEKFEQGKARSIYGTGMIDYTIMTYVIGRIEKHLYLIEGVECGLSGTAETSSILKRLALMRREQTMCTMLDYANFNLQHTLEAQALVFSALKRILSTLTVPADLLLAVDWCEAACMNQWCTFPGEKHRRRIVQGLFSGQRGNNFLNTILNVAYFRLAVIHVSANFNHRPTNMYSIHHGDNLGLTNEDPLWAKCVFLTLSSCQFVFNMSKQVFDWNRGEFLRVLYTKEGAHGYSGRAIPSLILKQLQTKIITRPT